jgi:hypothetical protein
LESYFNSIIQANIFNEMPFIGEKLRWNKLQIYLT